MVEWLKEFWPLALLLIAVSVGAAFMFRAAAKSSMRHKREFMAEEQYIIHLKTLKEKYVPLTREAIENAPAQELVEGVALGIQLFLQKQEDDENAFEALPDEKKFIYTLDVFESDKTLSVFFRSNSSIIKSRLVPALEAVGVTGKTEKIKRIALMFDDRDETVSFSEKEIADLDKELSDSDVLSEIKLAGAKYIKENPELFL